MGRRLTFTIGLILLAGMGLFLANRAGFFHRRAIPSPPPAQATAPAPQAAPTPAAATSPVNEAKVGNGDPAVSSIVAETDDNTTDEGTFVAIRYDKTHVLFRVADPRSDFDFGEDRAKDLHTLPEPIAEFGGGSLWEPDAKLLTDYKALYDRAPVGETWQLEITAGLSVPVIVRKPVLASAGCFSYAGVIAEASDPAFAVSGRRYFLVHKPPAASVSVRKSTSVSELVDWKLTPELRGQIEKLLQPRIKDEAVKMHESYLDEYERFAKIDKAQFDWAQHWKQADERLMRGEGRLDLEVRAFQVTPDGAPRLLVRAKSSLDGKAAFLMIAWLSLQPELAVDSIDVGAAGQMRMAEFQGNSLDYPALGTVLNIFDLHNDGRGELLIYSPGYEGYDIHLFRYTANGPVATSISHGGGC